MIAMYTARTSEVDVFDEAIAEIKSQIDFSRLKRYSGGIIYCCMDYYESGMVDALCKELPFDVIGMTGMGTASDGGFGFFDLTLTVLTSDEVRFSAGMTEGMNIENYDEEIRSLYGDMRARVTEDPSLIITIIPYVRDVSGYKIVAATDKAVGGIPLWGPVSSSINFEDNELAVLCNGRYARSEVAMLFLNGPVEPKFIIASLPENNISNTRGIVTKSDGATLIEVNDMPVLEYFDYLGVAVTTENVRATPLMIYHRGAEKPIALAFFRVFEDGSVLIGGEVPVGASIAIGGIDTDTILASARQALKEIVKHEDRNATLIAPCVTRGVMMIPDQKGELMLIQEMLGESGLPYSMAYAGGEISPMPDAEGKLRNHFHNYTFCACVL
jgi:hypothetical protein